MTVDDDDPGAGHGHDSAADTRLDLTPRTGPAAGDPDLPVRPPRKRTNPAAWVVLGLVVVALGFVVLQGLGNATLYFRNADEAVAERDELAGRDFRIQGLVVQDATERGGVTEFAIAFNDVEVPVESTAGPPNLFELCVPVVLEGRFADGDDVVFLAHRILVKHDETYEAENAERIDDATDGHSDGGAEAGCAEGT